MATSSTRLLKLALPLVRTHGFTRETLARSVLALPPDEAHESPLSDTAVSALFGEGDAARRKLIDAWMKDGLRYMENVPGVEPPESTIRTEAAFLGGKQTGTKAKTTLRDALRARLEYNEPVVSHLPEAFALLASPPSGLPPLNPLPALKHAAEVADQACFVTGDQSLQLEWYARRTSLAAIYAAAELHQLTSPTSVYAFLDSLLDSSSKLKATLDEASIYSSFIFKSWKGIIKSSGIL